MAKEYFSLSRSKILNKARPYPKFRETIMNILKNAPMKKAGFIGDANWQGGNKAWTIKVSEQNFAHIVKTLGESNGKKSMSKGNLKAMTYELATGKVLNKKLESIKVKFRSSGKIQQTAASTEEQEKGSAYIFDRVVTKSVRYKTWEDIVDDTEAHDALCKIFRGDVPDSWLISYFAQQKVLLDKVAPEKASKFSHSGGFMQYITNLCLKNFNAELGLGGKKDSWNPADIWIVFGNQAKIQEELEKSTTTIHELNSTLRQMFHDKRVMGISLKKTGRVAYYEEVNVDKVYGPFFIPNTKDYNFPAPMKNFTANFRIPYGDDMFTQDVKITIEGGGKTFVFQIKANSSDAKDGSNLKFEPTAKGSGTARLGKAPVDKVSKILKDDFNKTFVNDYSEYPKDKEEFEDNKKNKGEQYFRKVLISLLSEIDTDMNDVNDVIANIKKSFGGAKDRGTNTRCKLMGLDFFYQCSQLKDEDRREFITDMIFLAQKKAFAKVNYFGPFGKIY